MEQKKNKLVWIALATSLLYALLMRMLFGMEGWSALFGVMTFTFLFICPIFFGGMVVYLSEEYLARKWLYRIFMPWTTIVLFMILTMIIAIEGWACWMMISPIYLLASSIGGIIGGILRTRRFKRNKLQFSLFMLLPLCISPIESKIDRIPGVYEAYTYIDIQAPAEVIWAQVTRVKEIPEEEDTGYLTRALGFPRPVRAELNYEEVGAYREAVFTKGLVFHETVTEYQDNQKMVFNIKAYPYEIPSTTLDEHVVIGGDYFDVLNGNYELEELENGTYRLHLSSRFKMNTTFNFYAGWWGRWIMKDIQNNILRIQKKRAEDHIMP